MKKILFLTCFTFHLILSGQNIIPIPADSTSEWRILRGFADYYGGCVDYHNSLYYIEGTIMHNGLEFYQIYENGEFFQEIMHPPGPCDETYTYSGEYVGAIRTENGKVYQYLNDQEYLLLDFTLNVGDTLFSYISTGLHISSIDSVLVVDQYRRRFNFSNGDICNWMIEGIGHEAGLFEPMSMYEFNVSYFICYAEDGIPLYGYSNCILNVGYERLSLHEREINIFPNPTSGKITINSSEPIKEIKSYLITDMYGRIISSNSNIDPLTGNTIEINIEACKPGVYFMIINFNDKETMNRKIIIE